MQNKIKIEDFNYPLPEEKIAFFPLEKRDCSKLLIYDNQRIREDVFKNIGDYLPKSTLLVFNDTKVVKARLVFYKDSGARIELFCLEPANSGNIAQELNARNHVVWNCLVGNSRRWTSGKLHSEITVDDHLVTVTAERANICEDHSEIVFSWNEDCTFANILDYFGKIPLPPYIRRETQQADNIRYQTVYALENGSVAAPTAGLHFTPELIGSLEKQGIDTAYLTLHVGLGTFKPVNEEYIEEHNMHSERISIKRSLVEKLLNACGKSCVIPVGTTSCRSLESLFWLGAKLIENPSLEGVLELDQWYPYECPIRDDITVSQSLATVLEWLDKHEYPMLEAYTSLMITPEYTCRIADAIITNFHQPKSTLLLLISSFIGNSWHEVYDYALNHNFRFLSYGDSCLFFRR